MKILIAGKADVNAEVNVFGTLLHRAVRIVEQPEIVECLVKAGANLEARDREGKTPLIRALEKGSSKAVEILVAAGAKVNDHALEVAVWSGALGAVQALIAKGANVNAKVPVFRTLLHLATDKNQPDIVRCLVQAGANLETRSIGQTPVEVALEKRYSQVAKVLIAAGDLQRVERGGLPLLHSTAKKGEASKLKVLIDCGCDVNEQDDEGNTALHYAVMNEHVDCVEALLQLGAIPNIFNDDDEPPLYFALETRNMRIAELLGFTLHQTPADFP